MIVGSVCVVEQELGQQPFQKAFHVSDYAGLVLVLVLVEGQHNNPC